MKHFNVLSSLIVFYICCITLFVPDTVFADGPAQNDAKQFSETSSALENKAIELINQIRAENGLNLLKLNDNLRQATLLHNQDMITNNFFNHTGINGSNPAMRACQQGFAPYPWGECYIAENIAAGQSTPEEVVASWMESPSHREHLLNPEFRELGIGYSTGGQWQHYWTLKLGAQPMVLPILINQGSNQTDSNQVSISLTQESVSDWGSLNTITQIQISEDPAFSGAEWQAWSPEISFTLSANSGPKTVYVKYTDGTTEAVSSDTIVLSMAGPPPGPDFTSGYDNKVFIPFVMR